MKAPSIVEFSPSGDALGKWWSYEPDGRILCQLCPRACRLKSGDRGFCFVRLNRDDRMVLDTYGRSTGFCIDPIEKKPLNHFLPGTPVLSFGTAGCNLGCKFCQNWDISKSREVARLSARAMPDEIANAAVSTGCRSVAFTYNDPIIWAEYAIDTAAACHEQNIKTVAVTAGYVTERARASLFHSMDAANIDLKAFTEDFYYKLTNAHLDPVLETIRYVTQETDCWVELTNLVIPQANDGADEFRRMCDWVIENVGPDVPIHFTAFHPDFRMRDRGPTPHDTLLQAREIAVESGIRYPYVGNVHDVIGQSTYCPKCGQLLVERDWYQLGRYELVYNQCGHCGFEIAGRFEAKPGDWGPRRQPIRIESQPTQTSHSLPVVTDTSKTHQSQTLNKGKAMASVEKQASIDALTGEQLRLIQHAACGFVSACVQNQTFSIESALGELARQPIAGIYVTLKRGETLRGCCGMQGSSVPLARALADAATRTAKHDPRMAPIAPVELPHLTLTISILGPPRPIEASGEDRVDMIEIGRHGLRIRRGKNVGLLLPVVATERSWNARQFLDAVCNKAGLPPGSWLSDDSEVELFDGVSFGAPMQVLNASRDVSIYTADQLQKLRDWVTYNVSALETGATPFYYATDVSDTSVNGIALRVTHLPRGTNSSWLQLNIREGLPLQSTLFQMTQTAASALRGMGPSNEWSIDVAVLSTVIHHGTDTEHDLESVDGKTRSLILMDGSRWSMCFDQSLNNEMLLQRALQSQPFRTGSTMVYSAVCETTSPSLVVSWGPRGENTISTRPPAVAGKFYPSADTDRESLVDQLLSDLPQTERQSVSAAMVPHAGLQYSGRIAADVWRRIQLPKNVLIIGPKHTRDGVDWAVAPHDVWSLSETARMNGNVELAKQLAVSIDGMELDAAAHRGEHGTEVHLPLLYRLAPGTQVTAIAMAEAPIESLRVAANQLADCLAALDDPPLLVISSDMNHFADEEENRRRDRIALELLSKNDPAALLKTCAEQNISMCGRVPAALVLMTLHHLGKTVQYRETGYDTSGTITGDRSRVVGYAGVLL